MIGSMARAPVRNPHRAQAFRLAGLACPSPSGRLRMPKQILAFLVLLALAACNTVEGAGRDISTAGDTITDEAQQAQ